MLAFLKELQDEWFPRGRVEEAAVPYSEFATASERNLAGFLEPFGLENLTDTVWKLARNGGFLNAETLHFVDDAALYRLGIADSERALILLAAWLHLQQMHEYGTALVDSGFVSLTKLKSCTDEAMKRSGIRLMGHRRVLLRQIREELANREDLSEAPKASLFTSGAASGVRRARNPAPNPFHLRALWPRCMLVLAGAWLGSHPTSQPPASAPSPWQTQYLVELARKREGGGRSSEADAARAQLPGVATRPDLELKFANRETWHEPWRATSDACLTCNGGGYAAPKTPREFHLACEDGTVMRLG